MSIKEFIKKITTQGAASFNGTGQYAKTSYAQSGEDIIIEYLFGLRKIQQPVFIDIGAYDPVFSNNTYKFFLKGAKGINIDANPASKDRFMQERPTDINLNIGVGANNGEFDFYIMEDPSMNTFSDKEKNNLEQMRHRLKEVRKIKVLTINQVLEKYLPGRAVDLLSIDAEGVDFDIIQSLDFNTYHPKVICIETINYTPDGTGTKRIDLCQFIERVGYFEYANTNINSIFVNKDWWFAGKYNYEK